MRVLRDIVRLACKLKVKVLTWAPTRCAAGCQWRHVNAAKGVKTEDIALTGELIKHATKFCRLTRAVGCDYVREWPDRCDLWNDWRVKALTSMPVAFATILHQEELEDLDDRPQYHCCLLGVSKKWAPRRQALRRVPRAHRLPIGALS